MSMVGGARGQAKQPSQPVMKENGIYLREGWGVGHPKGRAAQR